MAAAELTPIIVSAVTGLSYDAKNVGSANEVEFDSSTGFYIDIGDTTQVNDASRFLLLISYGDAASTAGGIKIKSSTLSPYSGSGIPDVAIDLTTEADTKAFYGDTASTVQLRISAIGPLETARFKDTDGYINVAFDTDHSGPAVTGKAVAFVLED